MQTPGAKSVRVFHRAALSGSRRTAHQGTSDATLRRQNHAPIQSVFPLAVASGRADNHPASWVSASLSCERSLVVQTFNRRNSARARVRHARRARRFGFFGSTLTLSAGTGTLLAGHVYEFDFFSSMQLSTDPQGGGTVALNLSPVILPPPGGGGVPLPAAAWLAFPAAAIALRAARRRR
jgi:hypothetical protein